MIKIGRTRMPLVTIGTLAIGLAAGYVLRGVPLASGEVPEQERQTHRMGRLTSPFLECVGQLNADRNLVRVRAAAVRLIREAQARDSTLRVSVYARDLNNGPWIGIDEKAPEFAPASLWKVPLMMYILARAEDDPALLDQTLLFPGPAQMRREDSMAGTPDALRMVSGNRYSYNDLLFRMIAYSDNFAEELLLTGVSKMDVDRLLAAINAEDTYVQGQPFVTARTYAALFRVLYNATLFSRPMSEYGLRLLTQSTFRPGIRKYLPEGTEVAAKFGLRVDEQARGRDVQFHECGIVYHPTSPYTLCVMTRSRSASPEQLAEIVASISREVWEGKNADRKLWRPQASFSGNVSTQ